MFFHDRLIERWMCEIDADVVFHEFSTKTSPGDSLESKKFKNKNIFILFDCVNQLGTKNVKTVYVLDGDYLRPSFNPILDGGANLPPSWFFEYSSETVRSRKLKLCDF